MIIAVARMKGDFFLKLIFDLHVLVKTYVGVHFLIVKLNNGDYNHCQNC